MGLLGVVMFAALVSGPSPVDTSTAPPTVTVKPEKPAVASAYDPNKIICQSENTTGSNIPTRTCHTVREWEAAHRAGADFLDTMQRQSATGKLPGG